MIKNASLLHGDRRVGNHPPSTLISTGRKVTNVQDIGRRVNVQDSGDFLEQEQHDRTMTGFIAPRPLVIGSLPRRLAYY